MSPFDYLAEARDRPEAHAGWDILTKSGLVAKHKLKADVTYKVQGIRPVVEALAEAGHGDEDQFLAAQRLTWLSGSWLKGILKGWREE